MQGHHCQGGSSGSAGSEVSRSAHSCDVANAFTHRFSSDSEISGNKECS